MRNRLFLLTVALLLSPILPGHAQLAGTDTAPGDSCAGLPTGATRVTADADGNGSEITLVCMAGVWTPQGIKVPFDGATCTSAKEGTLRFTAASDTWEFCNGSAWVPFERAASGGLNWELSAASHNCIVRPPSQISCWGVGGGGSLGNGAASNQLRPVQVHTDVGVPGWTDWISVSNMNGHSCGLRSDGTAWCWGTGATGRLGNGATANQTRPVQVHTDIGLPGWTDWIGISNSGAGGCGIRQGGAAWCWGWGANGRLGNGAIGNQTRPVQMHSDVGLPGWTDWDQISLNCGIRQNGTAWCWGLGSTGRVGDGGTTDRTRPVQVHSDTGLPGWSDWVVINDAGNAVCGIRQNGTAWCWGLGGNGQLGNGALANHTRPVQVHSDAGLPGWSDWIYIRQSGANACGVRDNGTAWCWGINSSGQLGNGTTTASESLPVQVQSDTGLPGWSDWVRIEPAGSTTCGIRRNGSVWCWGNGINGGLGNGGTANQTRPFPVLN